MGKSIKLKSKILNKWTLTLSKPNSRTNSGLVDKLQLKKMPMPSKLFQALTFHARPTHAPLPGSLLFSSSPMKLKAHGQLLEVLLRAKKEAKAKKGKGKKEEKKADDDEMDLFGSDDDDGAAAKAAAEAAKASKKKVKKVVIAMSLVMLEVKPVDDQTNLDDLAQRIYKNVTQEGLFWKTEYKKEPVAFGIFKLIVGFSLEDEKVSVDDVVEKIEALDDAVQSVEIAVFNKI